MERVAARNRRVRESSRKFLIDYLLENACVDCGESDIRVLELDHRPGTQKRAAIAVLMSNAESPAAIAAEIAKCDVRCANCHRKRTGERAGWWREAVQADFDSRARTRVSERLTALNLP